MYDDYHEREWTADQVDDLFDLYVQWCEENSETQEIDAACLINEGTIGHVAYHAAIVDADVLEW